MSQPFARIGDMVTILKGHKALTVSPQPLQGFRRYIQITDLRPEAVPIYALDPKAKEANNDDVLIAWDGANAGTVGYGIEGIAGSTIAILRPIHKNMHSHYLARYLQSQFSYLQRTANGATIPHVNRRALEELQIPLPSLDEQRRIAAILDKVDELRALRRRALARLDDLAQSVFFEMFGDPISNERGWRNVGLGEVTSYVSSGITPKGGSSVYKNAGHPFIRSQNVLALELDLSDVTYIDQAMHSQMKRTWVKHGDVLLNITGASIGRVAVYDGDDDEANVNQHVCIIRAGELVNSTFLAYQLGNARYQAKIIGENRGATRQAFNYEQIKAFRLILPPITMQKKFSEFVRQNQNQKELYERSAMKLNSLFASLQSAYF